MREGEPQSHMHIAAEAMAGLWELEDRQRPLDLEAMMRRLKDLSAYSLTHAEILEQREGVELFALGIFFGMTSNVELRNRNQGRLQQLSPETVDYVGQAENIEKEISERNKPRPRQRRREGPTYRQRRLL